MIEKKKKKEKILSHVYFLLISLLVVFTTLSKVEGADWYNSAWNYCKKITIDHTKVPNSDQSNFPVLISRTDTDWKDTGNGGHIGQSDGGDILFTASNGTTKLFHEIEKYEPSTGRLSVWVKVTNLSHTTDTEIYIYYGNAGCPNQWDINGTWDEDYKMVQHFQESCAASNCHLDSTSNNNNGTPYSNTTITNLHTDSGKIEGADIFDGIDDYVDCGNNASLNISDVITIEVWVKKSLTGSPPTGLAITNCQELQNMRNDLSGDYYLANDIDCSDTVNWNGGAGFEPIGKVTSFFSGTFDGQKNKITNLYINRPSSDYVGLFGCISSRSEIKDIGLENVSIRGNNYVGALAGYVGTDAFIGSITNCYSTGSVIGDIYVGGLIAVIYCTTVTNCYSICNINSMSYVGGLGGNYCSSLTSITKCYSTGSVSGSAGIAVGGFVGSNTEEATISNSYWDVETSGRNNMCGFQTGDASGCDNSCGKTTAEMKQQSTFAGWDFTNTWSIEEGITYPFLQWQWDYLISKGRSAYSLQTSGRGSILYGYVNNNEIIVFVSNSVEWYHYVMTFDGIDQKLFVNGNLKNTSNTGGTIGINGNNVTIGGLRTCFNGAIDEVRISNKPRSEDWIKTSYNNQNDPDTFYNVGEEIEQYSYQTDNHIKNSGEGTYIGDNIYNTDGSNQTKAQNVDNGITATYHIRIENDGNNSDTFVVIGDSGDANWTVAYYDALVSGNNITANVTGSGWATEALISGGTKEIRVEVTPGAGVGGGTSREILITSTSEGDTDKKDAVKATTTVSSEYQTDNHIKNSGEGSYIGDNIYNNDGSNQTKAQNVDNGITAIYHIRIENDGNIADTFTVTGTGGDINWTVAYYDALVAGNNITANVTGSGWSSGALVSGGTKEIRVEVTPGAGAGGGTSREILITSTSQGDGNADAVKATTTVSSDYQTDNHIKNSAEGTYIGNNIYNTDGSNQTKAQNVDNGATAIYHIRIQNDGNIADTFTVTGTGGDANWIVTYYDALVAGSNITANVTGSGWSSGALVSGGTREIRMEVTPGAGAGGGTSREILITSTSEGDGNADAVKAVTTVDSISNYCVDNQIKNNGETSYLGNGIYNLNGADQTAEQGVENNQTATYHIKVENDGSLADTFTITGIAGDVNWTIVYYDALSGGNNITDNIISSGWLTGSLASGGIKEIRVEVTPGGGVGDGLIKEVLINSQSVGDTNKEDVVKAITTCINVAMPYIKIETKADGSGSEVDSQTINSEDSLIVYAVHRDTSGVYVANVEASWGLIEKTRGAVDTDLKPALDNKSATFTGHRVGTAKIKAEHTTLRDDSTGMITVVAGNPTHIKIVDNTGREIYTKAIDVGDSFPVYALSKDANENYVEDVAVTWSLIEKVGDIVDSDLVSALNNRSATFKGKGIGKAKIKACHSSLGDDETGDISVRISKTVFHPVYPNPFRLRKDGTVIFQYDLAEDVSSIGIEIYTLAGDLVRKWSGNTRRGRHRIFWDATNQGGRMVSSGMYFIVIKKDGKVISRKRMVIIK